MKKFISILLTALFAAAVCAEQVIERLDDQTLLVRSENGKWGGIKGVTGILPMLYPGNIARKNFDLGKISFADIADARRAALRMHIGIVDTSIYSKDKKSPGLNEKFAIVINGHKMEFSTADKRFPITCSPSAKRRHEWMDLEFPAEWLKENKILTASIHKIDAVDDLLYPGIDPTVPTVYSEVSTNGGKTFRKSWFNSNGKGELMMRLVISSDNSKAPLPSVKQLRSEAVLDPVSGSQNGKKLFGYARQENNSFRVELIPGVRDINASMTIAVKGFSGVKCFDASGKPAAVSTSAADGAALLTVPRGTDVFALEFASAPGEIKAEFVPSMEPVEAVRVQQALISPVRGKREAARDIAEIKGNRAVIDNGALRLKFTWDKFLKVTEFYTYESQRNMLASPKDFRLFIIRIGKKDYDIRNCTVKSVKKENGRIAVTFQLPDKDLFAKWFIYNKNQEFITSFDVSSTSDKVEQIKTVFPCLDGLKISEKVENDFYLYPTEGGYISNSPCFRREAYGYGFGYCIIGIMDLYSPEAGCGVYLRSNDPTGLYKHFNIRKSGKLGKGDTELRLWPILGRIDLAMHYGTSLDTNVPGTSFAIDYIERDCSRNEKVSYPEAAIGSHEGDWHRAMEIYAAWSHKVFPRHKNKSPLADVWNISAGAGTAEPLYDFLDGEMLKKPPLSQADTIEINGYWSVKHNNPWGVPITKASGWNFIDPVTKRPVRAFAPGDYGVNGYNPQWGGLEALKKYIRLVQEKHNNLILYTAPRIGDSETEVAKKHGKEWCVINPNWHFRKRYYHPKAPTEPKDLVFNFNAYRLCVENPEYQQWVIDNMIRLIRETGASGFRWDELGSSGEICLSTLHKHCSTYRRKHNNHLQAATDMAKRMRAKMNEEFGRDKLMLTEFIGHDMFNASFDGTLSWLVATNDYRVNPAPIHLYRFYFPGNKIFEVDEMKPGASKRKDWRYWLWNAVGVYNSRLYPDNIHKILLDNTDAMGSGKAVPLIPTLHPLILVNKFEAANGDVVWTVLNTARNTYHGAIINVDAAGKRYKEFFDNRKLTISSGKLITTIRPAEVLVIRESRK